MWSIPSRFKVFKVSPRVLIDNKASRGHTVIEVNGRDRPGLLYQVTQTLTYLNLIIKSARIATFGERAVDVFYVQDALGGKIESKQKLRHIEKKLLAVFEDGECSPARKAAGRKDASKKAAARKAPAKKAAVSTRATGTPGPAKSAQPRNVSRKAATAKAGARKAVAGKSAARKRSTRKAR